MAVVLREVERAWPQFLDRTEAGCHLAALVVERVSGEAVVLAIPRGGVAVARPVADALAAPLDVVLLRKLPLPTSPEAGFGAVTLNGTLVLNEELVFLAQLSREEIEQIVTEVREELARRAHLYRGDRPSPELTRKTVVVVDDGLASGYTMLAAVRMACKASPAQVVVAVPVSPLSSILLVEPEADEVLCLIAQRAGPFAVASFYHDFHDLTDAEVEALLRPKANPH